MSTPVHENHNGHKVQEMETALPGLKKDPHAKSATLPDNCSEGETHCYGK